MNKRILFVDDEENVLHAYKRSLRHHFEVFTADSGNEAIKLVKSEGPFAVVISDYRMPEMDGIELLNIVKQLSPDSIRIILTGFADLQIAIDAINEGNIYRFLTKPILNDKLVLALNDSAELYRLVTSEKELNKKLSEAYDTIKHDLESAAELQRYFLPEPASTIGDCRFDWLFLPSVYVSGDAFNYFPIDSKRTAFYIVDVAGHGLPAAFLSVSLSRFLGPDTFYRNALLNGDDESSDLYKPATAVTEMNKTFLSRGRNSEYFTMIYGIVDSETNKITFCQAGHPHPFLMKKDGEIITLGRNGFPVGILAEANYEDQEIDFFPGDRFILYTDGITECAGIRKKVSTQNKLVDFLTDNKALDGGKMTENIPAALKLWSEKDEFTDDITMLIVERCE